MWKKIIVGSILLTVIFIVITSLWLFLHKENIENILIETLNEQLATEVSINGDVSISLFSTFPMVSLSLQDVIVEDPIFQGDTMASLSSVSLEVNLIKMIQKEYVFDKIMLSQGAISMRQDENGLKNYHLFKKTDTTLAAKKQNVFELSSVSIKDIQYKYQDTSNDLLFDFFIEEATAKGVFDTADFNIETNFKIGIVTAEMDKTTYLSNTDIDGEIVLVYKDNCYRLQRGKAIIHENTFDIVGDYCMQSNEISIQATSKGQNIERALSLLPEKTIPGISGSGQYEVDATISGHIHKPAMHIHFFLQDGTVFIEKNQMEWTHVHATGSYSSKDGYIDVSQISCSHENTHVEGRFYIQNFQSPSIQIQADGILSGQALSSILPPALGYQKGAIECEQLYIELQQTDSTWNLTDLNGKLHTDSIYLLPPDWQKEMLVKCSLNDVDHVTEIEQLNILFDSTDFLFTGNIAYLLPFIQDPHFSSYGQLSITGSLTSQHFNINEFIQKKQTQSDSWQTFDASRWLNISGDVDVSINELFFKQARFNTLETRVKLEPKEIHFTKLSANAFGGLVDSKGYISINRQNQLELSCQMNIQEIEVDQLLYGFDNFGQQNLTHKNIQGSLDANGYIHAAWKEGNDFVEEELLADISFAIYEGELIRYNALQSLSKHLSVEQLEHVYFSTITSELSIQNRIVQIPATHIKSNLLSMQLEGTHSFDDDINYQIVLNLKNVLAAKFKKAKTLHSDYINEAEGAINIYVSLLGKVDNPDVVVNKGIFKKKTKNSFSQEKEDWRKIIEGNDLNPETESLYFDPDTTEYIEW